MTEPRRKPAVAHPKYVKLPSARPTLGMIVAVTMESAAAIQTPRQINAKRGARPSASTSDQLPRATTVIGPVFRC
jgi:hypothetical protein